MRGHRFPTCGKTPGLRLNGRVGRHVGACWQGPPGGRWGIAAGGPPTGSVFGSVRLVGWLVGADPLKWTRSVRGPAPKRKNGFLGMLARGRVVAGRQHRPTVHAPANHRSLQST